ncbi:hypothetical protein DFH08DRAFT_821870 [Mycena albidolilacea]|uniref:Uncharacterized protein n=1 Tax=Mycena albidolilacea TaxID=1033008 RepID=A0AAD7ED32_9AGAR|nr:hypothetical protein DFH08DRAFT_821870 [Mycena albidolilacea]
MYGGGQVTLGSEQTREILARRAGGSSCPKMSGIRTAYLLVGLAPARVTATAKIRSGLIPPEQSNGRGPRFRRQNLDTNGIFIGGPEPKLDVRCKLRYSSSLGTAGSEFSSVRIPAVKARQFAFLCSLTTTTFVHHYVGAGARAGWGARERVGCERGEKRGVARDSSKGTSVNDGQSGASASGSKSGATRRQKTQGVVPRRSPRAKWRNDIVDARDEEHGVEVHSPLQVPPRLRTRRAS